MTLVFGFRRDDLTLIHLRLFFLALSSFAGAARFGYLLLLGEPVRNGEAAT